MREGDVYRWYFKNEAEYRRNNSSTAYWCMDNQCIVRSGELVDTYWGGADLNRLSSSSYFLNPDKVDLEFICNLHDVEFIKKWQTEDYDKVYDLSYQKRCYPCYAIDKGAQISNKALHAKYSKLLEQAEYQKRSSEHDIEHYSKLLEDLK
ncbi:MAG: hypothetical protein ACRC6V_02065 [Bacteroidales bacterium]